MPITRDDLTAEIARLRAEAVELRRQAAEREVAAGKLEAAAAYYGEGLPGATETATVAGVTENQARYASRQASRGGAHPVKDWLYFRPATEPGPRSSYELSAELKKRGHAVGEQSVRTWWGTSAERRRRVPAPVAEAIEAMGGPSATAENWPNGIWSRKH